MKIIPVFIATKTKFSLENNSKYLDLVLKNSPKDNVTKNVALNNKCKILYTSKRRGVFFLMI
jgi:hypothetical protein